MAWVIYAALRAGLDYRTVLALPLGLLLDIIAVSAWMICPDDAAAHSAKASRPGKQVYIDEIPDVR